MLSVVPKKKPEQDLKRLFELRYTDLLRWAMQLTHFDRHAAEDLVHDAYVDLATSLGGLPDASNLDGYLYQVLRNLNASRIKRAWKHEHDDLDVLEFDSLHVRLRMRRGIDPIELQDQLMGLCSYLCWRKDTFRPASMLLLRFFRGFYPREIARLARLDTAAVTKQIERGRKEAEAQWTIRRPWERLDPPILACDSTIPKHAVPLDAFIARLTAKISSSKTGLCFSSAEMEQFYGALKAAPLDTPELAHLVACDKCLAAVCELLNMNPPDDRLPFDYVGQDPDAARKTLRAAERTIEELRNHEPSSLILAINGDDIYKCNVGRSEIRHAVTVPAFTTPEFIEIFSHIGLRLARLDVVSRPPDGPAEMRKCVTLGAGRELSLILEWYGQEPQVRVGLSALEEAVASVAASGIHSVPMELPDPEIAPGSAGDETESMWRRFLDWLGTHSLIPAVASALGGAMLLLMWQAGDQVKKPGFDASTILQQASQAEAAAASQGISHRIVSFAEFSPVGTIVHAGRVEIWHGGVELAKRFYDAQGRLTAGEWKNGRGPAEVLEDGKLRNESPPVDSCLAPQDAWGCDLSAATFSSMAGRGSKWKTTETPSAYVITVENTAASGNAPGPHLVRARLTIDRSSMRSREANLWVRERGQIEEYHYVEVRYNPNTGVSLDSPVFRPDANLQSRRQRKVPRWKPPATSAQLAHLQLQVLLRLHAIGDDVGQPLLVERTPDGKLSVRGVVASDSEAQRIRGALSDLALNPLIRVQVYSTNELKHQRSSGSTGKLSVESYEVDADRSPADHLLRSHFETLGFHGSALDEQIRRFSNDVLSLSAQALQQAWAFHKFKTSFSETELDTLSTEDKRAWFVLLNDHTNAVAANLDLLRQKIAWMVPSTPAQAPAHGAIAEMQPPEQAVDRVLSSTSELNQLLQAELIVTAGGNDGLVTDPAAICSALGDAQRSLLSIQNLSQQYNALLTPQGPR